MRGRILSIVMIVLLLFDLFAVKGNVMAAVDEKSAQYNANTNQVSRQNQEETLLLETETLRDFGQAVMEQLQEKGCIEDMERREFRAEQGLENRAGAEMQTLDFASRTLIVSSEKDFDTCGAIVAIKGAKTATVLIFHTKEDTQAAYQTLQTMEGTTIESVTVNSTAYVAEMNEKGSEEEWMEQQKTSGESTPVKSVLRQYIDQYRTDSEVVAALIDTGIDLEKDIFQNRLINTGLNFSSSGEAGSIQDDNGHGSTMAELITETTNENIKFMPIKAANENGSATVLGTFLALQAAIEEKADLVLISMNGFAGSPPILKESIQEAVNQGMLVVVSAGNNGMDVSGSTPADLEEALVVSAVEQGVWSSYTNYGTTVDFCADGVYQGKQGTSYAAARTAGMGAELLTFMEKGTDVTEALENYAQGLGAKEEQIYYGNGYLGDYLIKKSEDGTETPENPGEEKGETPENPEEEKGKEKVPENPEEEKDAKENLGKPEEKIQESDIIEKDRESQTEEQLADGFHGFITDGSKKDSIMAFYNNDENFSKTDGGFNLRIDGPLGQSNLKINIHLPDVLNDTSKPVSVSVSGDNIYGIYQREVTWTQEDAPGSGKYRMIPVKLGFHQGMKAKNVEPKEGTYDPPVGEYAINGDHTIDLKLSTNNTGFTRWHTDDLNNPILKYQTINLRLEFLNFNINYDSNGGTGTIPSHVTSYGDNFSIRANLYQKTGNTFKGYAVVRSSDNKVYCKNGLGWQPMSSHGSRPDLWSMYSPGGGNQINEYWLNSNRGHWDDTFTFYAQWQPNTYTIRYHGNGAASGSMAEHAVSYGNTFKLQVNRYAKTGHTFKGYAVVRSSDNKVFCKNGLGWQPMSTHGGRSELWSIYSPGSDYALNQYWIQTGVNGGDTFTFYAQWKKNSYTITYSANGGKSVSQSSAVAAYGDAIHLGVTAVPKDSYDTFIGWGTSPNAKEALANMNMGAEHITLYALYSIPVSDVKQVYLQVWDKTETTRTKLYPLTRTGTSRSGYTYKLDNTNYAAGFPNASNVRCRILSCDNANNWSIVKAYDVISDPKPDIPVQYLQTVEHYRYDRSLGKYVKFAAVNVYKNKGDNYTPQYLTAPDGYQRKSIDGVYTVNGPGISRAYYDNIAYTLYFNASGGIVDTSSKTVYFGEPYGEMPRPERVGYTFQGWFTAASGGTKRTDSDLYQVKGNSTLYARWKIDSHMVYYDYAANGGTGADKTSVSVTYQKAVDLSVNAHKNSWTFLGWNTDPNAREGLSSLNMGQEDIYLYAIYKKSLSASFVDEDEKGKRERKEEATIYNNETTGTITIPIQQEWEGWDKAGWTLNTNANGVPDAAEEADYHISGNVTFYGLYTQLISVTYDTNGPGTIIPSQSASRYYNASGSIINPIIILAQAPESALHSFVSWADDAGNEQLPETNIVLEKNMLYIARWDRYPEIEAYDRYFTLEQAQNGSITQLELLKSVTGTDLEDGLLINGRDVAVKDFRPDEFKNFTEEGSLSVTYDASDSFGNHTEKLVTVHLVDTAAKESNLQGYLRFINSKSYREGTDYVIPQRGGLEEKSLWKTDEAYRAALDHALSNQKTGIETRKIPFFGVEYQVELPGSGSWEHVQETWTFSTKDREQLKDFITEKGFGKIENKHNSILFYENFNHCRNTEIK